MASSNPELIFDGKFSKSAQPETSLHYPTDLEDELLPCGCVFVWETEVEKSLPFRFCLLL